MPHFTGKLAKKSRLWRAHVQRRKEGHGIDLFHDAVEAPLCAIPAKRFPMHADLASGAHKTNVFARFFRKRVRVARREPFHAPAAPCQALADAPRQELGTPGLRMPRVAPIKEQQSRVFFQPRLVVRRSAREQQLARAARRVNRMVRGRSNGAGAAGRRWQACRARSCECR